jgi:glycosyltransferase involved in cell wall biosynthesis
MVEGFATIPEVRVHVVCCLQQPVKSPEKLADNVWFHGLHVPKTGWLRTGYQGCIRAVRRKLKEIQPDIVQGIGTERDCAISAVFSGFPNVIAIAGNMAELARLDRARPGSYGWLTARLENFLLPRTAGVICNSLYTVNLVKPRARKAWLLYPGLRSIFLQPPTFAGPRPCTLIIAGVISARKRQLELLELAEALHRRGLKFQFQFVGFIRDASEPYAVRFLERIKPMTGAGYACYLGAPTNQGMVECFDAAAGMIHFPTEEAFGSVVAEGLARDLKFFGAGVGGIVEIARDAPEAELFGRDDWDGLSEAIVRWIEKGHPSPAGAAALMRQRYHPEVHAREHLAVYREVLAGRRLKVDS